MQKDVDKASEFVYNGRIHNEKNTNSEVQHAKDDHFKFSYNKR